MEKALKIDVKQRENLVSLLNNAKTRDQDLLEAESGISEQSILRSLAKEAGVDQHIVQAKRYSEQIKELENKRSEHLRMIRLSGFSWNGDELDLDWNAQILKKKLRQGMAAWKAPILKALKKYDTAIALVWAAMTPDELRKSVEGVL